MAAPGDRGDRGDRAARSAAEREAARQERERRRQERRVEEGEAIAVRERDATQLNGELDQSVPEPAPSERVEQDEDAPAEIEAVGMQEEAAQETAPQPGNGKAEVEVEGLRGRDDEARLAGSSRGPAAARHRGSGGRRRAGGPATQARKGRRRPPNKPRSMIARVGALAALAILAVLVWLIVSIFQPFQGSGHGKVVVVIPPHTSASGIGSILARDGVIESGFFFDIRAMLDGKRGALHAGRFLMKRGMSYEAAITALTTEKPLLPVSKVVIPEGETRAGIAAIAHADGLAGNYLLASRHASGFNATGYGAPKGIPNLEGFLFPATYDIPVHAQVKQLVDAQLEAFQERFGEEQIASAHKLKLTAYQLLIVASMIEREAKLPHDRPLIAAVIYNRLRLGMPLGIDATIRFAVHNYTKPLTEAQLHVSSPYNTRLHTGLPPTPISDPGMEAIEAAAHPAKAGYLYYVDGADGCGELVFSNTSAEFERNATAYQEAVAANGGNPPACKRK